jgi:hypothetical protein
MDVAPGFAGADGSWMWLQCSSASTRFTFIALIVGEGEYAA